MNANERYQYLLQGFLDRTLHEDEVREFLASEHGAPLEQRIGAALEAGAYQGEATAAIAERVFLAVTDSKISAPGKLHQLRSWWVAASIILVLGIGAYLWARTEKDVPAIVVAAPDAEILPGKEGAILTLSDGSEVVLDSLGNGLIAAQNGAQVVLHNGVLAYDPTDGTGGETMFNTMSTPKGRQFQLLLPDGTKVWLNAGSSIRYPTLFHGNKRKVIITGEAYFEVAKNEKMPFHVTVNNQIDVEVLGTHFNVNAYENEGSINTTLIEGRIRVNGTIMEPGQQAQLITGRSSQPTIHVVSAANLNNVIAWKEGLINFDGVSLEAIMRQIERWYDITVQYENNIIPNKRLAGAMTRDVPLDGLLKNLSKLGVQYRLQGKILLVLQ